MLNVKSGWVNSCACAVFSLWAPRSDQRRRDELGSLKEYRFWPIICFKNKALGLWNGPQRQCWLRPSNSKVHQDLATAMSLLWPSHKSAVSITAHCRPPPSQLRPHTPSFLPLLLIIHLLFCDSDIYSDNICISCHSFFFFFTSVMLNVIMTTAQTERTSGNLRSQVTK